MRLLLILLIFLCSEAVIAQSKKTPYSINADSVEYDKTTDTITAEGRVEIFKDNNILKANKISYNKTTKKAFAYGNVTLITSKGEEIFADSLEIDKTFKEGMAHELTARLKDQSFFTAKEATIHYPENMFFDNGTYSACNACSVRDPQWQLRAKHIDYHRKDTVAFTHGYFDIYGMPVFYTPYLKIKSPDAEPQSGFLLPKQYKYHPNTYGYGVAVPYYWRIADNKDLVYSPIFTTKKYIVHSAKFRYLFEKGRNETHAEFSENKSNALVNKKHRYYLKTDTKFKLSDRWNLNKNIEYASDKSYTYDFFNKNQNYLASSIDLSYVNSREYGGVSTKYFQDLRAGVNQQHYPFVLPVAEYHKTFRLEEGNDIILNTNAVNIQRNTGLKSTKGSIFMDWCKTYGFDNHEIEVSRSFTLNSYQYKNRAPGLPTKNVHMFVPEASAIWRYPFIITSKYNTTYIAPTVNPILSPSNNKNAEIIEEDSQKMELYDTNLFSNNRYPVFDKVENGTRVNYGLVGSGAFFKLPYNFLLGQVYRTKKDQTYSVNSGLQNKNISDYIGKFSINPVSPLELHYNFNIDSKNYKHKKDEVRSTLNIDTHNDIVNLITLYGKFSKYANATLQQSALQNIERSFVAGSRITFFKEWQLGGEMTRNFSNNKYATVQTLLNLGYNSECTSIKISAIKNNTQDLSRGIRKAGYVYSVDVILKNIN